FYSLADRLGIERISKWGHELGLGRKTGIDLPNEAAGVMPSEEWKAKNFRQRWYAGETISVGIGQGAVAATPIQLARTIAGIAMGGVFYRPHVVMPGQLAAGLDAELHAATRVSIDPQNWITITDAMAAVVNPGGTANSAHLQGIDFAGKTGSAQVVSHAFRKGKKGLGFQFNDNGFFAGFAPRRNPGIVVVVLVEQGIHGDVAARIAAKVVKAYVEKQRRIQSNPTLFSDTMEANAMPAGLLRDLEFESGEEEFAGVTGESDSGRDVVRQRD
ncbi:MAG TPA: penicillin-binding transpeptidase domain-containing protein, partial [Candidatus Angelobacter sp.]|nr:penicillin-binding transpeptidase domain-containing protein [Candidatus Angelobacter sp.]